MWTQNVLKATDDETKEVYLTKTGGWKLKNDIENKIEITDSSPIVKREATSKIAKKEPIKESNSAEDSEIICLDSESEEEGETKDNSQNIHAENEEHENTVSDEEFNRKYKEFIDDAVAIAERETTSDILNELFLDKNNLSEQLTPSRKRKIDQVEQSNVNVQRSTARTTPRNTPPRSTAPPIADDSSDDDIICLDSD